MLKILFLASEVTPFTDAGKQGDMVATLAPVLKRAGHEVRVVTPRYENIRDRKYGLREVARLKDLPFEVEGTSFTASIKSGFIPCSKVQIYFIENPNRGTIEEPIEIKEWNDPLISTLLLTHSSLNLTCHLDWYPDIIYLCGERMALAAQTIRTLADYTERFSRSRIILQRFDDSLSETFDKSSLSKIGISTDRLDEELSFAEMGHRYADYIIDPVGTVADWLEFLSLEPLKERTSSSKDSDENQNGIPTEEQQSDKTSLLKKLGLHPDPEIPLVAFWSGAPKIDEIIAMLKAEFPMQEAQWVALGDENSWKDKSNGNSNPSNGNIVYLSEETREAMQNVQKMADILFVPTADETFDMFDFCHKFDNAVPLLSEDLFTGDGSSGSFIIPNYAQNFVFPSGDTKSMIDALRKATETYKNPLTWNDLVQRSINRELCCEQIARNISDEFQRVLREPPVFG